MDMFLYGSVGALGLAAYGVYSMHNRLAALDERCNTAFSDIDVQLKHRHSVIPALVESVKGFAGHESQILVALADARSRALSSTNPDMRLEAETQVGQCLTSLISVVENYPQIEASAHFRELRAELTDVENRITAARRFYNTTVDELNSTVRQFPGNIISGISKVGRRKHFDLGMERMLMDEPVSVKF